jgi:crotonobetainyl-CoA:carnitine CoA-transferase CaiB-like acyl-CoA transferase
MPDPSLADRIRAGVRRPAVDAEFDVHGALSEVLAGVGLSPGDAGGRVEFTGADPIVPSTMRLGAAAGVALAAKSIAIAALWQDRGGDGQDIAMDLRVAPHRLCPFYDRRWELLNGYPGGSPANASPAFGFLFYPTADGRWVMPMNPYPKVKVNVQRLLGVPDDRAAAAAAIARWSGAELEAAGRAAGVVLPMLRTVDELLAEEHFSAVLADLDLVQITKIGDSAPEPLPSNPTDPLDGIRALGMGHVIAGAGAGRALALHGADVLNIWRPGELEHDSTYQTANVGVRSCTVDPYVADGRAVIETLLRGCDVFYANRRPGYLDQLGLDAAAAAEVRPGIVHATASLNGETGPWAGHVGFDQTAGSLTGMMLLEGGGRQPALPPILVVNDYIVSWLMVLGIVVALRRRARDGGSYRVHVSLTRAALWILSLGVFDLDYARSVAGSGGPHAYLDPELFTADTPLGRYQGVTEQVRMSRTPGRYRYPLLPRGAAPPQWEPRPTR